MSIYSRDKTNIRLWNSYTKMKRRCYNPEDIGYIHYGGRGIKVCDEWKDNPSSFFKWAKENGYRNDLTIDRIDVNGNYEPSNCRWATKKEQSRNKTNNRWYTFNGKTQVLSDWAMEYEMNVATLRNRLGRGWDIGKALTTPIDTKRRNRTVKRFSKGVM